MTKKNIISWNIFRWLKIDQEIQFCHGQYKNMYNLTGSHDGSIHIFLWRLYRLTFQESLFFFIFFCEFSPIFGQTQSFEFALIVLFSHQISELYIDLIGHEKSSSVWLNSTTACSCSSSATKSLSWCTDNSNFKCYHRC